MRASEVALLRRIEGQHDRSVPIFLGWPKSDSDSVFEVRRERGASREDLAITSRSNCRGLSG